MEGSLPYFSADTAQPRLHHTPLWELESDFMLHNPHMMRLALADAAEVALSTSEAALLEFHSQMQGQARLRLQQPETFLSNSAAPDTPGAPPDTMAGLGDWWSQPLQRFQDDGLPRLQVRQV